ncbi:TMEM175 family protein [Tamlana sp. 2_MG-2023]|uniref:TMEM175 family protein n=1 Tax=unclassified Tamlana TaxID=2614803 RepID=UPI0026E30C26|nr:MULTISPECIES: TMEM175 family protein [unclassified Tamlana]MDO6761189.1 TMEM175 family protein [Tamlana sp. 2_MG-2023]MDO6791478.1 TMEM175 family protein [Tamlana sp. 1_MG-2023]
MKTGRLEAFSDGVLAIIITIMVFEIKAPEDASFESLKPVLPVFLTYVLSFVYLAIYWNNHHHLLHAVNQVNGKILWANLNLLFWLSLFPFVTGWMGENHFETNPTAMYGIVLFMAAFAFKILVHFVIKNEGKQSNVGKVYSNDKRLNISLLLYLIGISIAFIQPIISLVVYLVVALIWVVPDSRIEKTLKN